MPIVNNFRRMNLVHDKQPPHLVPFFTYKDFKVFSSNYNELVFVVHNKTDDKYYVFENQGSDDIKNDLIINIQTYFEPIEPVE